MAEEKEDTVATILNAVPVMSLDTLSLLLHDAEYREPLINSVGKDRARFLASGIRDEMNRRVKSTEDNEG